jgi:type II secretory pathway predicted ATPase ExeA
MSVGADDALGELIQNFDAPALPEQPALGGLLSARSFLEFYGLTDNPFPDCVHPGFFYRTESHADAFRSMMLAVEFNASLGMVTGRVAREKRWSASWCCNISTRRLTRPCWCS